MKTAILIPTFSAPYGIEKAVADQARDFACQGHEVTIFTLKGGIEPPQNVKLEVLGMPNSLLFEKIYRLLFPFAFIKWMKWVRRLKGFDIIYSHDYPMHWLAYLVKRRYGIRYIYFHHHFNPPQAFPTFIERTYIRLKSPLEKWTIRKADGAISRSQFSRQQLKNETGLDSQVIYDKVDAERFHKGIDGTRIRQSCNLGNAPVIFFAGRLTPTKGIHLLIEAFNLIKRQIPEAKLVIVGTRYFTGYSKQLRKMSDSSTIFVGGIPDGEVPYYYAMSDVCATASLAEGFNLFLAEAQACGKPVVAFDIGPHAELIKDKEMVVLVPARDTKAMADAIIKFLAKKAASHGEFQK